MSNDADIAKQFDQHLRSPRQVWLLGAGVSYDAGIPLMQPLTDRIMSLMHDSEAPNKCFALELLQFVRNELPDNSHIEHMLSHLGDMVALAERAKDTCFQLGEKRVKKTEIQAVHHQLLGHIRDILRWGFKPKTNDTDEKIGSIGKPIVNVNDHRHFIKALYRVSRAGVDAFREPVHFVTTNYDTLIEDALSLERLRFADGFTGGAIAHWSEEEFNFSQADTKVKATLTKLHGSIDWYRTSSEQGHIFRVRYDELYPDREAHNGNVVIYPQSTKYLASREDPFGFLFQHFRKLLAPGKEQVFFICGYSFGDDHINAEMEQLILHPQSRTTVVAFSQETKAGLHPVLKRWCKSGASQRIFVATENGLYRGSSNPNFPATQGERDWWTFSGVTRLLEEGLPPDMAESIE